MPSISNSIANPNATGLVRLTYTATGITFAKATEANLAIANTQSGVGTLTDVIAPVTLATGTITTANPATTAITGVGTDFENDFAVGQYMFYYDETGEPALLGKIATVSGPGSIVLTANASTTLTNATYCGMAETILATSDNILIQIPVVPNGQNSVTLPNWGAYRNTVTGFNNTAGSNLEQYSLVNAPQTQATPPLTPIPYTVTPVYNFQSYNTIVNGREVVRLFSDTPFFPSFCYAVFNPYGQENSVLAPNTLYKLFASESFQLNGIKVTTAFDPALLAQAGY